MSRGFATYLRGYLVTWQDELRRIDAELAAGRLSAVEYRKLRDALLASQSGAGQNPGSQAEQGVAGTEPAGQPVAGAGPFPPPFRWEAASSGPTQRPTRPTTPVAGDAVTDAETTQVLAGEGEADRTQVVHDTARPHQQGQLEPPLYAGTQRAMGPALPSWRSDKGPEAPWPGLDLPPNTNTTPPWYRQGPEVFESDSSGSTLLRVLGVIGAVILLAGISVGSYILFKPSAPISTGGTGGSSGTAAASATSLATPSTIMQPDPPIADLPGKPTDTSKVKNFTDVEGINYLTDREIAVYRSGGAEEARLALSNVDGVRIIVLVVGQSSAKAAAEARDDLADLQLRFKMDALRAPPGVLAAGNDAVSAGPLRRAHYASDRYLVRVQVQGKDLGQVEKLFTEVLGTQLDELPADA